MSEANAHGCPLDFCRRCFVGHQRTFWKRGAARTALCSRAADGLLTARARLLTIGKDRHENGFVPAGFWWARGHEALDQDWKIGDFSTWIEQRVEWRAYGVTFDLGGIFEMLPAETRPIVARRLSVAGDTRRTTAQAALAFLYSEPGAQPAAAGELLIDQCRLGFVAARAVVMQWASRSPNFDALGSDR